jgi:hypothetical protein
MEVDEHINLSMWIKSEHGDCNMWAKSKHVNMPRRPPTRKTTMNDGLQPVRVLIDQRQMRQRNKRKTVWSISRGALRSRVDLSRNITFALRKWWRERHAEGRKSKNIRSKRRKWNRRTQTKETGKVKWQERLSSRCHSFFFCPFVLMFSVPATHLQCSLEYSTL